MLLVVNQKTWEHDMKTLSVWIKHTKTRKKIEIEFQMVTLTHHSFRENIALTMFFLAPTVVYVIFLDL